MQATLRNLYDREMVVQSRSCAIHILQHRTVIRHCDLSTAWRHVQIDQV